MFRALRVTNSIPVQALFVFFLFLYGPGEFFPFSLLMSICRSYGSGVVDELCVGSPMMYSYMVKQRGKTLAGGKERKEKK